MEGDVYLKMPNLLISRKLYHFPSSNMLEVEFAALVHFPLATICLEWTVVASRVTLLASSLQSQV